MNYSPEQFLNANQSNLQTMENLAAQAFTGFEKLVELNVATFKTIMSEVFNRSNASLNGKDPQEFLVLQAGLLQPMAEKSAAYSQNLYTIVTSTGTELTKTLEAKVAETQMAVAEAMENFLKNAPAGTETAVAAFRSAVTASKSVIETAQNSARKAAEVVESNFTAATNRATNAAAHSAQSDRSDHSSKSDHSAHSDRSDHSAKSDRSDHSAQSDHSAHTDRSSHSAKKR